MFVLRIKLIGKVLKNGWKNNTNYKKKENDSGTYIVSEKEPIGFTSIILSMGEK